MKHSAASIVSGIALALVMAAPIPTYASSATFFGPIVPTECHCDNQTVQGASGGATTVNSAPDFGCVLAVIQNLINFGITLSAILFTIYLVLTGFSFITSAGSSEARSKAKTRFTNVFVGLIVLLCAWLIVDFVMKTIYDEGKFGPWNGILAGDASGKDHCIVARKPTAITAGSIASNINTETPGTYSAPGTGGYTGGGLSYQAGVQKQIGYESTPLANLLACMASKLPPGVGQISAISEQAIADGSKTMQQCSVTGCAHTANSCHYGGPRCPGLSYAVDFGDENNAAAIRSAARSCDPNAKWNPEGNHVHISVGSENGCGCDGGLSSI